MKMIVEKRAECVHIEGYVNAVERESKTLYDSHGNAFNEMIMAGTFQRAIDNADEVLLKVDHERTIGGTKSNLTLMEDAIGLRAVLDTDDAEIVEKADSLKGWSFGFNSAVGTMEERANHAPLRRIDSLVLDEVSLIVNKTPAYAGTLAECRADGCKVTEERAWMESEVEIVDRYRQSENTEAGIQTFEHQHVEVTTETITAPIDYTEFEGRIAALKNNEEEEL